MILTALFSLTTVAFTPSCNLDRIRLRVTKLHSSCAVTGTFLGHILYLDKAGRRINPDACGFPGEAWGTTMLVAPEIEPTNKRRAWYGGFYPGDTANLSVSTTVDGVDYYTEVTVEY